MIMRNIRGILRTDFTAVAFGWGVRRVRRAVCAVPVVIFKIVKLR